MVNGSNRGQEYQSNHQCTCSCDELPLPPSSSGQPLCVSTTMSSTPRSRSNTMDRYSSSSRINRAISWSFARAVAACQIFQHHCEKRGVTESKRTLLEQARVTHCSTVSDPGTQTTRFLRWPRDPSYEPSLCWVFGDPGMHIRMSLSSILFQWVFEVFLRDSQRIACCFAMMLDCKASGSNGEYA